MTAKDCFRLLAGQTYSVSVAAIDEDGLPVSCVAELTADAEDGLYLLTAKNGVLCGLLNTKPYAAVSGTNGKELPHRITVSVHGWVEAEGAEMLPVLLAQVPSASDLYPDAAEKLAVFRLYAGSGEWTDLSEDPPVSGSFTFGAEAQTEITEAVQHESAAPAAQEGGYTVTDSCIGCGTCTDACPNGCITLDGDKAVIRQDECLQCGCCADACPVSAIEQQ